MRQPAETDIEMQGMKSNGGSTAAEEKNEQQAQRVEDTRQTRRLDAVSPQ